MPVVYRPGTLADSQAANSIMERAFVDMARRLNGQTPITVGDPKNWEGVRSMFEHLGRTAEHFWFAELDGLPIGYARSILRGGVRELTEFFVLPDQQSAGVGRELLARAFPAEGARHRSIIATTNPPVAVPLSACRRDAALSDFLVQSQARLRNREQRPGH